MRITIDTETDTYDNALAALRAAFGRPDDKREESPVPVLHDGLSAELLLGDWNEQRLYALIAGLIPKSATVLRCIAENAPRIVVAEVLDKINSKGVPPQWDVNELGGAVNSLKRSVKKQLVFPATLVSRDKDAYVIDIRVARGLLRAFRALDAEDAEQGEANGVRR
ncbi:hypothetical protein [Catenulispora rubra]|uniref:hypothetical protein n=1 Tax=Catenulispora rubra TaxID=280293 RepID=UPI0018921AE3|nr:hypothetical protein [Catenulispora rubra]